MSAHRSAVCRRCIAPLLLVTLQGTACQAWHTEDVAPQAVLATHQPTQLRVTRTDGCVEYHEVKGYRREAAIVRLKSAAKQYPQFRFVLVTKADGFWRLTTIGAK